MLMYEYYSDYVYKVISFQLFYYYACGNSIQLCNRPLHYLLSLLYTYAYLSDCVLVITIHVLEHTHVCFPVWRKIMVDLFSR